MLVIGVDVGGTHTDAVLVDGDHIIAQAKVTTTANATDGIKSAIKEVLRDIKKDPGEVVAVMIGTTHLINALLQRRGLLPVLALRLGAPATTAAPPGIGWDSKFCNQIIAPCSKIVKGGYEYNGPEISPIDPEEILAAGKEAMATGVTAVAITGVFSHVNAKQEWAVKDMLAKLNPAFKFSLSHQQGGLGLLARENATIINACLIGVYGDLQKAMLTVQEELSLANATLYLSNSTGTIEALNSENTIYSNPILTLNSGPTNSIRGVMVAEGISNAVVIDVGGTSTELGLLRDGFPVMESAPFEVVEHTKVECHFPKPRVRSVALGGGTIIRVEAGGADGYTLSFGPESVGRKLRSEAWSFGGEIFTLSDLALLCNPKFAGELHATQTKAQVTGKLQALLEDLSKRSTIRVSARDFLQKAYAQLHKNLVQELKDTLDATEKCPRDIVLVGGGAKLFDVEKITRELNIDYYSISIAENAGVINAAGAAKAQVSHEEQQIYDYNKTPRQQAIFRSIGLGVRALLDKGVDLRTIAIGGRGKVELKINYLSGNPTQLTVTLVGDMALTQALRPAVHEADILAHMQDMMVGLGFERDEDAFDKLPEQSEVEAPEKSLSAPHVSKIDAASIDDGIATAIEVEKRCREKPRLDMEDLCEVLDAEHIEAIACGAGILGSGGGGSPALGRLMAQAMLAEGKKIYQISLDHLEEQEDPLVLALGVMGSPIVLSERLPSLDEGVAAILRFEQALGRRIDAIVVLEGGGTNATYPLFIAARLGIPVVDADCMGRAFPGIDMVVPNLTKAYRDSKSPLRYRGMVANSYGAFPVGFGKDDDAGVLEKLGVNSLKELEDKARQITVDKGGIVTLAYLPMTGALIKHSVLPNTLSVAREIGNTIRNGQAASQKRSAIVAGLADTLKAMGYTKPKVASVRCIAEGRIISVSRDEIDGFTVGGVRMLCDLPQGGSMIVEVGFQNENLMVRRRGKQGYTTLALVPNIITLVDSNTFQPVSCEELVYGLEVAVLTIPVPKRLQTREAQRLLGKKAYKLSVIKQLLDDEATQHNFSADNELYFLRFQPETVVELHRDLEQSPAPRIALLVSMGQSYYEGAQCRAALQYLEFLSKEYGGRLEVEVVVADTLQVHNALDEAQLGADIASWELLKKSNLEHVNQLSLSKEDAGKIYYAVKEIDRTSSCLVYKGMFGHYSFISSSCSPHVALMGDKSKTAKQKRKDFSGRVHLEGPLPEDDQEIIKMILNALAHQEGQAWLKRNMPENMYPSLKKSTWEASRNHPDFEGDSVVIRALSESDPVMQLLLLRKIMNYLFLNAPQDKEAYKDQYNHYDKDVYRKEYLKDKTLSDERKQEVRDALKPYIGSAILAYIMEETIILMRSWSGKFARILYQGEEPLFEYLHKKFSDKERPAPKWVAFDYKQGESIEEVCVQQPSQAVTMVSGAEYFDPEVVLEQARDWRFYLSEACPDSDIEGSIAVFRDDTQWYYKKPQQDKQKLPKEAVQKLPDVFKTPYFSTQMQAELHECINPKPSESAEESKDSIKHRLKLAQHLKRLKRLTQVLSSPAGQSSQIDFEGDIADIEQDVESEQVRKALDLPFHTNQLSEQVRTWLLAGACRTLRVGGERGMGKRSWCIQLYNDLLDESVDRQLAYCCLVSASDLPARVSYDAILNQQVAQSVFSEPFDGLSSDKQCRVNYYVEQLKSSAKVLVIIVDYDSCSDKETVHALMSDIIDRSPHRLLLAADAYTGPVPFELNITLQPFSNPMLKKYLEPLKLYDQLGKHGYLFDLVRQPRYLSLLSFYLTQEASGTKLDHFPGNYLRPEFPQLKFEKIPRDGHCLFNAIGLHLGQDAAFLRQIVAARMEENFHELKVFREGTDDEFRAHIAAIRDENEWGGHIEIEAVQRLTDRPIIVIRPDANPTIPENLERLTGEPIFIYYNGQNHYDAFSLREGSNARDVLDAILADIAQGKFESHQSQEYPTELHSSADLFHALIRGMVKKSIKDGHLHLALRIIVSDRLGDDLSEARKFTLKPDCKGKDYLWHEGGEKLARSQTKALKKAWSKASDSEVPWVVDYCPGQAGEGLMVELVYNPVDKKYVMRDPSSPFAVILTPINQKINFDLKIPDVIKNTIKSFVQPVAMQAKPTRVKSADEPEHLPDILLDCLVSQLTAKLTQLAMAPGCLEVEDIGADEFVGDLFLLQRSDQALGVCENFNEFLQAYHYAHLADAAERGKFLSTLSFDDKHSSLLLRFYLEEVLSPKAKRKLSMEQVLMYIETAWKNTLDKSSFEACYHLLSCQSSVLALAANRGEAMEYFRRINSGIISMEEHCYQLFIRAIKDSEVNIIEQLLASDAIDLRQADAMGKTLLDHAVDMGNVQITQLLLDEGAGLHVPNIFDNGTTPLLRAVMPGDLDLTRALYHRDPENVLLALDHEQQSALHHAVSNGQPEVIKFLITHSPSDGWLNAQDAQGRTPWLLACQRSRVDLFEYFIQKPEKIDFSMVDERGDSALMLAIYHRSRNMWALTLDAMERAYKGDRERYLQCLNLQNDVGDSALMSAIKQGDKVLVQRLLECGADTKLFNDEGKNPLMLACVSGNVGILKLVVGSRYERLSGFDLLGQCDKQGNTILHLACMAGQYDLLDHLLAIKHVAKMLEVENRGGKTPLMLACGHGKEPVVKVLLDCGVNIDKASKRTGLTALHHAARADELEILQLLFDKGSNKFVEDDKGRDVLSHACEAAASNVLGYLLSKGSGFSPEKRDHGGLTPLHHAAHKGDFATVKTIRSHCKTVVWDKIIKKRDNGEQTPLFAACFSKSPKFVRFLLEHGANTMLMRKDKKTALMAACQKSNVGMVEALVAADSTPRHLDAKDTDGHTALHFACMQRKSAVVARLLEAGANPSQSDFEQGLVESPLINACKESSLDSAKLLLDKFPWLIEPSCQPGKPLEPLFLANAHENEDLFLLLLEKSIARCGKETMAERLNQPMRSPLPEGGTLLASACQWGNVACVRALCEAGASWGVRDSVDKSSPLHLLAQCGHLELMEKALEDLGDSAASELVKPRESKRDGMTRPVSILKAAVFNGHIALVRLLVEHGAPYSESDLVEAAIAGKSLEVVQYLHEELDLPLTCSADIEDSPLVFSLAVDVSLALFTYLVADVEDRRVATSDGQDLLMCACQSGQVNIVHFLLERRDSLGLDVRAKRHDGVTALMLAAVQGNLGCVVAMIAAGAEVNAISQKGVTALLMACQEGHTQVASRLIAQQADIGHIQSNKRMTPLHFAVRSGKKRLVAALLRQPDMKPGLLNQLDQYEDSPLVHCVATKKSLGVLQLLLSAGAHTPLSSHASHMLSSNPAFQYVFDHWTKSYPYHELHTEIQMKLSWWRQQCTDYHQATRDALERCIAHIESYLFDRQSDVTASLGKLTLPEDVLTGLDACTAALLKQIAADIRLRAMLYGKMRRVLAACVEEPVQDSRTRSPLRIHGAFAQGGGRAAPGRQPDHKMV